MGKIKTFFGEVREEMQAVDWPSKKDLRKNTVTVLGVVAVFTVFFMGTDSVISSLLNLLR